MSATTEAKRRSYSPAEHKRRWDLARAFMHREQLDALILYGEHEDVGPAAFDFDTWITNDRPGSTIVFPREGEPIELVPFHLFLLDHIAAQRRGDAIWISAENIRIGRDARTLAAVLRELKLDSSVIGVVGLAGHPPWHAEGIIPFQLWNQILKFFSEATFRSVQKDLSLLTMKLGSEDIVIVKECASIGDEIAKAMVNAALPGALESDVYAAGMTTALNRGVATPWPHLFSDPEPAVSGLPHWTYRPQAPRKLRNGDVIHCEAFAQVGMRTTQHQITIAIGDVHKDTERAAAVARASYEAGLRQLRPGVLFSEVCKAMLIPVEEAGGWVCGPQTHGLNPLYALCDFPGERFNRVPGVEQYPNVHFIDILSAMGQMQLEPGMSFSLVPSCGFGRHLVSLGGTVIVSENRVIELNAYTAELKRVTT